MYLSAHEAAKALGLSYFTIVRYAGGDEPKFPNARLRDNSRRKGLRIPASEVLAYAAQQGEDVVAQAERIIAEVRTREEALNAS